MRKFNMLQSAAYAPALPGLDGGGVVEQLGLALDGRGNVRTDASGRLAFTAQTACCISLSNPSVPARSVRRTNVTVRAASKELGP